MRRTARPLPLLFVVLGHAFVVLLFLMIERGAKQRPVEAVLVYMLPITENQTPPFAVAPESPPRTRRKSRPVVAGTAPTVITPPAPMPEPATIQTPPIDWQRELESAARRSAAVPDSAGTRQRSLDSRPKVLELPRASEDPPPGTVTLQPNGDRTVRYKNGWTCTSSDPPLAEHFSVWAQHRPPKCRPGARPEYKLDVKRPGYLEQTLPDLGAAAESAPIP